MKQKHGLTTNAGRPGFLTNLQTDKVLILMVLPGVVWLIMFRFIPMAGSVIAFQDYQIFRGIADSPWVGLANFQRLFSRPDFARLLRNTLILGFLTIGVLFPVSIVLAISINEITRSGLKRVTQTLLYLPYFFSWVIISGLFFELLGARGPVNQLIQALGGENILFVQRAEWFRAIVTAASVYRDAGWGTIIFLAAIAGINPELYEVATIDGASRLQKIRYITFPSILPTIVILLMLRIGQFMNLGFERIYVFLTPMTYSTGDIFDTYVYRVGIAGGQYSMTTAIGLFQSLVGLILIVGANRATKRISGGLW